MRQYDQKRYNIAPWRGRFGDQAHALRVHPHTPKIERVIADKKREMLRLEQQIRQLEVLSRNSSGTVIDGVLVRELCGPPGESDHYSIALVSAYDWRSAKIYPNAQNKRTFGLEIHWDSRPFSQNENRGWGHTREQAIEGARAWVLREERQPRRYDRKDGTIREEGP